MTRNRVEHEVLAWIYAYKFVQLCRYDQVMIRRAQLMPHTTTHPDTGIPSKELYARFKLLKP
jgi:hypothetical protein